MNNEAQNNSNDAFQRREQTLQTAVAIAREQDEHLDETIKQILQQALSDIWAKIEQQPHTSILTRGEFAVFNTFIADYEGNKLTGPDKIETMTANWPEEKVNKPDDDHFIVDSHNAKRRNTGTTLLKVASALAAGVVLLWVIADPVMLCFRSRMNAPEVKNSTQHYTRATTSPVLNVFQVYPPVLTSTHDGTLEITDGSSHGAGDLEASKQRTCQETLVVHTFAYSYGIPYIGQYTPPSCSFNRVTWNLTVTSAGRQFDRLGTVWFGDIEVFRTSTAEPTKAGIVWTYLKDMTNFLSLFKTKQKIIFDLGNLIDNTYTGSFNVTLTASFFTADDSITPADLILPVSTRQSSANMPSIFTLPPETASNIVTLPRNIKKAVFTISATGQQQEEFWWSNVLQSNIDTFPDYGQLYGYSPFREVQLFIDGSLAGVAWPFPIIFTGGVVPGLWRPIVGIDAFDLKEDEIDVSPWLPLLCDGKAHNFTIRVSGLNDNGKGVASLSETTDTYWLVSGKIFLWLDNAGHVTTGSGPFKNTPAPRFTVSSSVGKGNNGTNETLSYSVAAQRSLSFQSVLNLAHGPQAALWQQTLSFSNQGTFTEGGNVEVNTQKTTGFEASTSFSRRFVYPLYANTSQENLVDGFTLAATINRGKSVDIIGEPVFPTGLESFAAARAVQPAFQGFQGASLVTTQNGNAIYTSNTTSSTSVSYGETEQDMKFSGIGVHLTQNTQNLAFPSISSSDELFHRYVSAVNGTVIEDDETLINHPVGHTHAPGSVQGFTLDNVPGRGGNLWHRMRRGDLLHL
ncbi:Hypothetical protein R9X50_00134200 [Acrodontium crateriforme]|uniref:Peptide N-acetyl-beta-D-glucosaminyl asparaginase amidase A N-terminal domain-containing protein n=1 Tax=Acrodontium crateriforme TaxID=150365 RepID=A0AAQ3R2R9_9PEZI|nr:Hypothetical protein R9X50_00134200 [Acrodontium crateriforme]